ncbi:MAG: barstar family protein [Lachnospiraceae bacterium]|nr:barstar family protein [Lachnospiraceae bacterium]
MRKVIADLRNCTEREGLHDVLQEAFDFPSHYGRNLDALYDLLCEISEDTCVAVIFPERSMADAADDDAPTSAGSELSVYLDKLLLTFTDAEFDNPHLCVLQA